MVDVEWSEGAIDQVEAIVAYVAVFNAVAAHGLNEKLFRLGDSLEYAPLRGRPSAKGTRELVTASPYIIRYRVVQNTVRILAVYHSARKL